MKMPKMLLLGEDSVHLLPLLLQVDHFGTLTRICLFSLMSASLILDQKYVVIKLALN